MTTTVSLFQKVASLSLVNIWPMPVTASNLPSAPRTHIPSFLFTSIPNSCAFHRGISDMLAPVSKSTVIGVVFFEVFGDGVFEEIRREYYGVSEVEAL